MALFLAGMMEDGIILTEAAVIDLQAIPLHNLNNIKQ